MLFCDSPEMHAIVTYRTLVMLVVKSCQKT